MSANASAPLIGEIRRDDEPDRKQIARQLADLPDRERIWGRDATIETKAAATSAPDDTRLRLGSPMAQPPTAVLLSFVPAENLRLYRLGERTRFRCVRCQQDKTAALVATKGSDWKQTICSDCYDAMVPAQRETKEAAEQRLAKKASMKVQPKEKKATKRHQAQAKQPSMKVEPKEDRKPPRLSTKSEWLLQRRLPGIDQLLAFFRDAGVLVEVRGGGLLINGIPTGPLGWILPSPGRIGWNNVIDEMALKCVGDKFLRAVEDNARFGEGHRASLRRRERGFAIVRGDVQLAILHPSRARILNGGVVYGNFLKPGPHWQRVADAVHGAEAELRAKRKQEQEARTAAETAVAEAEAERRRLPARRRIEHLPHNLGPELIRACLDASRRLRLERQVAYERPVVLESGGFGELTLLPITGTTNRLLMPFQLTRETKTLKGELVLGDRDPLPLRISEDVADEDAITAWTCALLGFADATCIEFEPVEPTARREPARLRWHLPSSVSHHRSSTRTLPRKRWPNHLEPVGRWVDYSGAFVAGHRRRLCDGKTATAEARDRARQVGIILHPHETWVRPHTRGVPDGIEMRFLWHAPTELRLPRT